MRDRTADLLRARQALSQLSYNPTKRSQYCVPLRCEEVVGLSRFELPTSPLSGVRSNQLSYRPTIFLYILIYVIICVDTGMQTSSFV